MFSREHEVLTRISLHFCIVIPSILRVYIIENSNGVGYSNPPDHSFSFFKALTTLVRKEDLDRLSGKKKIEKPLYFKMGIPKIRTSISKKRIRKNIWKRKGYWAALKAFSLGKSISTENSKSVLLSCGRRGQKG